MADSTDDTYPTDALIANPADSHEAVMAEVQRIATLPMEQQKAEFDKYWLSKEFKDVFDATSAKMDKVKATRQQTIFASAAVFLGTVIGGLAISSRSKGSNMLLNSVLATGGALVSGAATLVAGEKFFVKKAAEDAMKEISPKTQDLYMRLAAAIEEHNAALAAQTEGAQNEAQSRTFSGALPQPKGSYVEQTTQEKAATPGQGMQP